MAETFTFDGFDGYSHTLKNFPEDVFNYRYFLIVVGEDKHSVLFPGYYIFCFNGGNIECKSTTSGETLSASDENPFFVYYLAPYKSYWDTYKNIVEYTYNISGSIVYCSDNLLQYSDVLSSGGFSLDLSQIQSSAYVLSPIVEKQSDSYMDVFGEVFRCIAYFNSFFC